MLESRSANERKLNKRKQKLKRLRFSDELRWRQPSSRGDDGGLIGSVAAKARRNAHSVLNTESNPLRSTDDMIYDKITVQLVSSWRGGPRRSSTRGTCAL